MSPIAPSSVGRDFPISSHSTNQSFGQRPQAQQSQQTGYTDFESTNAKL
jgi:hypothetical protein